MKVQKIGMGVQATYSWGPYPRGARQKAIGRHQPGGRAAPAAKATPSPCSPSAPSAIGPLDQAIGEAALAAASGKPLAHSQRTEA
jgi:hypothetical protein